MDAFEEPFALDEEPTDLHGEDDVSPDVDTHAQQDDGEPSKAAAERDSMYVSLFEGESTRLTPVRHRRCILIMVSLACRHAADCARP
jgi:hypothetical protein